jgi:hypothetical protein
MTSDGARDVIKVSGPATVRLELVVSLVEGRVAPGARVDARFGEELVKLVRARGLCALLPEDAELF